LIRLGASDNRLPPSWKTPKSRNRVLHFERNRIAVVMIRLARIGAPKKPFYRIVVIEKDRARNGRSIEVVGTYNPRSNPPAIELKRERIDYWRSQGAKLSPTVEKLLTKASAAEAAAPVTPAAETPAASTVIPVAETPASAEKPAPAASAPAAETPAA
jgi:small subunit ribosomal protein S16